MHQMHLQLVSKQTSIGAHLLGSTLATCANASVSCWATANHNMLAQVYVESR